MIDLRKTRTRAICAAIVLLLVLILSRTAAAQDASTDPHALFENVTEQAGFTAVHHDVYMITGQAWADVNQDGWLDLYLTDSDGPNSMYLNNGDGTFSLAPYTGSMALWLARSGGAVFADYDNDGWPDLYVLNWGDNVLFRNDQGQGFTDVTMTAGVGDENAGKSATWGDYDKDGYLDLYIANWSCSPECGRPQEGDRDRLYHNNGDGTFTDVTNLLGGGTRGAGFAVSFLDYDNDGDADIYLVNDEFLNPIGNKLWRNDGPGCDGWCFTEVATDVGADERVMGMGLAPNDYDNDGDLDLFFSNAGQMVLLQNQGDGAFADVAAAAGVALDSSAIGWGAIFFDYDHDGWRDLYLALTAHGDAGGAYNVLFRNNGDGTFSEVNNSGAADPGESMGVAYADYDNDGWVDFVVGNGNEGYHLYRNLGREGTGNNWLSLALRGADRINRDAVGARVTLTTSDGRRQMEEVTNGASLGAGSALTLYFGLGEASIERVEVEWPNGLRQQVRGLVENRRYELAYAGIPRWLDAPPDPATPSAGITAPFRLPFSPLNLAVALILGLIILIPALRWLRKRARPKK
ncbi:MAG: CRTAC1 family protein [Anaerolineales bacterium]|nr:CRTAC1 family protein [Anaerolineales bacterium]MCB8950408.1 CRTAC1 family protein [Ardenticatenales bacterium]